MTKLYIVTYYVTQNNIPYIDKLEVFRDMKQSIKYAATLVDNIKKEKSLNEENEIFFDDGKTWQCHDSINIYKVELFEKVI